MSTPAEEVKLPPPPIQARIITEYPDGRWQFSPQWLAWFNQLQLKGGVINADLVALGNLTGVGFAVRTGDALWSLRSIAPGTGIDVTNGTGVSGNTAVALSTGSIASLVKADTAVQSVVAGTNVTVNNADPRNPVVNASGGGGGGLLDLGSPATASSSDPLFDFGSL